MNNSAQSDKQANTARSCHSDSRKPDYLLRVSLGLIVLFYLQYWLLPETAAVFPGYESLVSTVFELINTMWWGILLGILMLSLLSRVPRDLVMSVLGTSTGIGGIARAVLAGVLLDLCNHGILMVGAKLYERGASIGQVIAFLVASPWNSFSLTLILWSLIGLPWTLAFIALSAVIALLTGCVFDLLVRRQFLPANDNSVELSADFRFWPQCKALLVSADISAKSILSMLTDGLKEARMILRWIFFGVLLAGIIRAVMSPELFSTYFGPSLAGLGLTLLAATIIEVCSEGSTPIAADLLTRANAPGNSFAFLMTGVATDYTEIMVLRETTKSWKIPLFLPLVTVPQILLVAWLINQGSV